MYRYGCQAGSSLRAAASALQAPQASSAATNLYRVAFQAWCKRASTATLPTQVDRIHVEFLDQPGLRKLSRLRERQIRTIVITPMTNEGNTLEISFTDYLVDGRKRRTSFALEGGGKVRFRFDCTSKTFPVEKVDFWGV